MELTERVKKLDEIFFDIILNEFEQLSTLNENLNIREFLIIKYLGKYKAAIMSELISVFATPPTTMTSIINGLVDKDYVKRQRKSDDRRIVEVILSSRGQEFYDNHQKEAQSKAKKILSSLSKKDQEKFIEFAARMSNHYKVE